MASQIPTFENSLDEFKFLQKTLDLIGERITDHESRLEQLTIQHQKIGERLGKLQRLATDLLNIPPTVK